MPDTGLIIHQNAETLSPEDQDLLRRATENQQKAYAPYSEFLVGAALVTAQDKIVGGANQENASYPLCMCGERVALYNSAVQFPGVEIATIAIVVRGKKPMASPAPPCGACLQVIREFEYRQNEKPIRLLLKADSDRVEFSVGENNVAVFVRWIVFVRRYELRVTSCGQIVEKPVPRNPNPVTHLSMESNIKKTSRRQLAAIMFTDIAGYTALMQVDEKRAMQFLSRYRNTLQEEVVRNGGELLQHIGDGKSTRCFKVQFRQYNVQLNYNAPCSRIL